MKTANETAEHDLKPLKGVYVMTDMFGNQRKVKITPAQKSMLIEMIEPSPKRTNTEYDEFIYKKRACRVKYDVLSAVYYWNEGSFKIYPQNGSEPLYFEFEDTF